jgi:hypothetical protein
MGYKTQSPPVTAGDAIDASRSHRGGSGTPLQIGGDVSVVLGLHSVQAVPWLNS